MTKQLLTAFLCFAGLQTFGQLKSEVEFTAVVTTEEFDEKTGETHNWRHLSVLTFKKDSVFQTMSPAGLEPKKLTPSVSHGGFYYYSGTLEAFGDEVYANLKLDSCVMCPKRFIRFVPPKLVRDSGTIKEPNRDTKPIYIEANVFENPTINHKSLKVSKGKRRNTLLVDKTIYHKRAKT